MASTTTYATLKQFAYDVNFDGLTKRDDRAVERAIAAALERFTNDRRWSFLRETKRFQTTGETTATSTLSISVGSTALTAGASTFASTDVGAFVEFSGQQIWYEIAAYGSATAVTLVDAYQGSAALSLATGKIIRPAIDMPADFVEVIRLIEITNGSADELTSIRPEDVELLYASYAGVSTPHSYAVRTKRMKGSKQLWLYPPPDDVYQYQMLYHARAGYQDVSASNVWVLAPTADTDIVTLPDDQIPLLRKCIKMCLAEEYQLPGHYDREARAYGNALYRAQASDNAHGETLLLGREPQSGWGVIGSKFNV